MIKAQDESSAQARSSGCAPSAGGCGCGVGYGNTLQLEDGRLLTATSFDIAQSLDIALWEIPSALKSDDGLQLKPKPVPEPEPEMEPEPERRVARAPGSWAPRNFSGRRLRQRAQNIVRLERRYAAR